MNKFIVPLIIVILLMLGGFVFWKQMTPKPVTNETTTQITQSPQLTQGERTGLSTLRDLLAQGVTQQCTYAYTDEKTGKSEGIMLMANGKVRGVYTLTDPKGVVTKGNMINDGAYSYVWDDTTKTGMKIEMTAELKNMGDELSEDSPQVAEMNKKTDYRCKPWVVDTSTFIPPTDVQFSDLSKMMENLNISPNITAPTVTSTTDTGESSSEQCAICDTLPAEAQTACRSSMNCD